MAQVKRALRLNAVPSGQVLAATRAMGHVAKLLGLGSIDFSQQYVDVSPSNLEDLFANAM